MDESDGHAALAHSTRHSFDGVVAHVTSREHARQAGLQGKWMAIEFPGGEVAPMPAPHGYPANWSGIHAAISQTRPQFHS